MTVLLLTVGMLVAALAAHLLWWRVRLPRNHSRALLIVFAALPVACIAMLAAAGVIDDLSPPEWALIGAAYTPAALAYVVLYSIIENRSPTLDIIEHIAAVGAAPLAEVRARAAANAALAVRLDQFADGGVVLRDGENFTLTRNGAVLATLFAAAAALLGVKEGG
ncbi:MAG: hypothetical protein AB7M12_09765 [Hyphomonadaceae bacterium]